MGWLGGCWVCCGGFWEFNHMVQKGWVCCGGFWEFNHMVQKGWVCCGGFWEFNHMVQKGVWVWLHLGKSTAPYGVNTGGFASRSLKNKVFLVPGFGR